MTIGWTTKVETIISQYSDYVLEGSRIDILLLSRNIFSSSSRQRLTTKLITEVLDSDNQELVAHATTHDFVIANRKRSWSRLIHLPNHMGPFVDCLKAAKLPNLTLPGRKVPDARSLLYAKRQGS